MTFKYMLMWCLLLISFGAFSDNDAQTQPKSTGSNYFLGEVEYKVTADGSNQDGVKLFKAFQPTSFKIIFGQEGFRLIETGGLENHVILNLAKKEAYFLKDKDKSAVSAKYYSIDDAVDEQTKQFLKFNYATEMADTNISETIAGQPCRKFKVINSAFVRKNATAFIWLTEKVNFRKSRYNFETDYTRVISPLPLSIAIEKGAVLKMEIVEDNVHAIYEAVSLKPSTPDKGLFTLPSDYTVKAN